MATRFLDPDQHIIYFNGKRLQGFADGKFIAISQMSKAFESVVGTDGDVTRSKTNDRRAEVTVSLMQSSPSNDDLSTIHNTDLDAPAGAGVGTFLMQDLQGTTVVHDDAAWVEQFPDDERDRTAKGVDWKFTLSRAARVQGGNIGV